MKPAVLVIATPIVVGTLFGVRALAGVLAGSLVSGLVMALASSNAGGAWDQTPRNTSKAASTAEKAPTRTRPPSWADTVGDPFKDTSGPSLNILMKLMAILSLVFAPFFRSARWDLAAAFQYGIGPGGSKNAAAILAGQVAWAGPTKLNVEPALSDEVRRRYPRRCRG